MSKGKVFRVVLGAMHLGPRFVFARLPVDLKRFWPEWKSRRVAGEINGFGFRTSLLPMAGGKGIVLLVNKKMQKGAKVAVGSKVEIWLEPDLAELVVEMPKELVEALKGDRRLRRWFDR